MDKWRAEYCGDDCFWEWWEVTDGEKVFKTDCEEDARWLCSILNEREKK